jgi:hypothetical protein
MVMPPKTHHMCAALKINHTPEGLVCHDPGLTTALVMYLQVVSYFWGLLIIFKHLCC